MSYNVYNPITNQNTTHETLEEVAVACKEVIQNMIDVTPIAVNVINVNGNGDTSWTSASGIKLSDLQVIPVDKQLTDDQKLAWIIDERNKRLSASDWTQLPDVVELHDQLWVSSWKAYRQALRDLPTTIDINNPVYPVPPL